MKLSTSPSTTIQPPNRMTPPRTRSVRGARPREISTSTTASSAAGSSQPISKPNSPENKPREARCLIAETAPAVALPICEMAEPISGPGRSKSKWLRPRTREKPL